MTTPTVTVLKIPRYEELLLNRGIELLLDNIGGIERIIPPNAKVFVKVNLLPPPSSPENAIITHPLFVYAVCSVIRDITPHITIGDDVDGEQSFQIGGYYEVIKKLDVKLLNLREDGFKEIKVNGKVLKSTYIAKAVLDADIIVNLPKLKTHSLTMFTGAIKNFYGIIPLGLRIRFHGEHSDPIEFAELLVDIFSVKPPTLTIMDGILAMEGAGPANGKARWLGLVIGGTDAVAVDAIAQRAIGLDPFSVWTTRIAHERGLGVGDESKIKVIGTTDFINREFQLAPSTSVFLNKIPPFVVKWALRHIQSRPSVKLEKCVGCQVCMNICPAHAIILKDQKACIYSTKCIRCLCCHEVCRTGAIALKVDWIGKFLISVDRLLKKLLL